MVARKRKYSEIGKAYKNNLKKEAVKQKKQLTGKVIACKPGTNAIRIKNIEKEGEEWEAKCNPKFLNASPKLARLNGKYERELGKNTGINL